MSATVSGIVGIAMAYARFGKRKGDAETSA